MTILWTGSPKLFRLAACLRSESVRVPSRSSYWMKFKFGWPNHRSCLASNLCCDGITIWGPYVQWGSGFSMLRWISRVGGWACWGSARRPGICGIGSRGSVGATGRGGGGWGGVGGGGGGVGGGGGAGVWGVGGGVGSAGTTSSGGGGWRWWSITRAI